jgi:parvulin-like peptidyl-prolyl isomerase
VYYIIVIGTGYFILRKGTKNRWTAEINKIFPYFVATVGKDQISLSRFELEVFARQYYARLNHISGSTQDIQKFVMHKLEVSELYHQELLARKLSISNQDVQNRLNQIYLQMGGSNKLMDFMHQNYGPDINLATFIIWIRESLEEAAITQQVLTNVTIKHILISVPANATPDQVASAKQHALDIKAKISSPAMFASIAKEYSDDVNSRDNGGEIGTTNRGDNGPIISTDFENAIFSLPLNTVSDPIRSPYGWHLVMVENKQGSVDENLSTFTNSLKAKYKIHQFYE